MLTLFLISCGESTAVKESKSAISDNSAEPKSAQLFDGDISAKQNVEFSFSGLSYFEADVSSGYTFEIKKTPSTLAIDENTAEVSGYYEASGLFEGIYIQATSIADNSIILNSNEFSIAVNGDPLLTQAWHINNTGQRTYSSVRGTAGYDVNLLEVLNEGITGKGVKIAISDSGVEVNHDDLFDNQLKDEHRNYSIGSPYEGAPTPVDFHGTSVAGLTSAVAYNNFGSMGIAPGSKFAGFLFLADGVNQTAQQIIHQAQGDFDIFNYSYGDFITEDDRSLSSYLDQLSYQTLTEDKVYVKAAGNEYFKQSGGICASHNANFPYENESPHMIIVGALNADGHKSSYSNAGSNLWVTAPGGEDGETLGPSILTTDLRTCFKGLSSASSRSTNHFEYNHSLNLQCDYTALMNGTSASTPIVSGVIALMREVNSNLKMRDIKHILALTSVQVDPSFNLNYFGNDHWSSLPGLQGDYCDKDLNLDGHEYEQGWVENKATTGPGSDNGGFVFSNFYGFGLIDAKAAVDMAKTYTDYLPTQQSQTVSSGTLSLSIPNHSSNSNVNAGGRVDTLDITAGLFVESVQVDIQITHEMSGEMGVELTSPSGTKSILMNINNSFLFSEDQNLNIVLTSNAFYGEPSQGTWILKVIDGQTGEYSGTLTSWKLKVLGH